MAEFRVKYSIYQHQFERTVSAPDKDRAWTVFWQTARHTGEKTLPADRGVMLSLLRNRAHITLDSIEEIA